MSVPESTQTTTPLKLVLLDDSLTARYVLTALVKEAVERVAGKPLQIYTSSDGVQGLGYIFILDPELIILDASLPKYSGRELVDYLTTNPKFADYKRRIVILQTKEDTLKLPSNYTILQKNSPHFVEELTQAVLSYINPEFAAYKPTRNARLLFGKWAIRGANLSEKFIDKARTLPKLLRLPFYVLWLTMQVFTSFPLTIFRVLAGDFANTNIAQQNRDLLQFRIQHYPSALTFLMAVLVILFQLGAFVTGGFAILNHLSQTSYAAWFDNSWTYRKALVVNGTSAGAQTDYVMQVIVNYGSGSDSGKNVYCASNCKTDFGDIRFVASDETTQLSYFLEQKTDSTKAMFWVKIPAIPASPATTVIYVYYGNGSATTSSDPENTYLQFEGFESTPFDFDTGAGVVNQAAGGVSGSYQGTSNNGEVTQSLYQNDTQYAVDSHFFEGWVRYPTNGATNENLAGGLNFAIQGSGNNGYQAMLDGRPGSSRFLSNAYIREDGSATGQTTGSTSITNNVWYFLRAYRTGTTLSAEIYTDLYGSAASTTNRTSESTYSTGYTGVFAYSINNTNYDNFRVRKRANPEPTYGSWGGQTTQSAVITASSSGSQTATVYIPDNGVYLGGKLILASSVPTTVTSIKIREQGSIDAQTGLNNIKLRYDLDTSSPYDCASESYAGTESQYGSTDTDGFDGANGSSNFTGSASISTTSTMCIYVISDITTSATNAQTIEIDIANPNNDVQALTGTVTPGTAVAISGTTTAATPGWYSSGWLKRKRVTIASTSMVSGSNDLTDFPVVISLTTDSDLAAFAQPSGGDIVFTDSNGTTKFDHDIETYTASSGKLTAWVKIPSLHKSANNIIYMYYGNASATDQQSTSTWSNYKGVWHMAENPAASAPQVVDSTVNANNLTSAGSMASGDSITGLIGNAVHFDGSNDNLSVSDPANGSLDVTTEDFSIVTWIRTSSSSTMTLTGKGGFGGPGYREYLNSSFSSRPGVAVVGSGTVDSTPGAYSHSLTNGGWHNLVVTFDRDANATFYIDGTQVVTLSISSINGQSLANADIFYIARNPSGVYWNGDIDELRIVNGVLDSSWISTGYNNVATYQTPTLGSAEIQPGLGNATVLTQGTQVTPIDYPQEAKYIGGSLVVRSLSVSANVNSVTLTESGTMDASYIENVRLYYDQDTTAPYDCASESYGGSESQFGSTNSSGFTTANGTAQVTSGGGVAISTTSALCLYPVFDFSSGISDDSEMEISIANPSTDVGFVSGGSITETSAVAIAGTSVMNDVSAPWYNSSWSYRKRVVIQDSQVTGSSALTNFPVLINLSSDAQLSSNAQTDADDIVFTSADGTTKLDHEIEKYTNGTGALIAWVRVPSLAATANTTIFMYYGNGAASNQQSIDATWSSEYKGVWHLAQDPSVSAPQIYNSADNTFDGTSGGSMTNGDLIAGKVGDAIDFDGTDDYISMGNKSSLNMGTGDFVVQGWTKLGSVAALGYKPVIFAKGGWGQEGYRFEINNVSGRASFRLDSGGSGAVENGPGAYGTLGDNAWHFITIVFDRNVTAYIYVDGTQAATNSISAATGTIDNTQNFYINRVNGGNYFAKLIDEPRIRTGLITSDWVATEYNNQNSPSSFIFLASQEMTNAAPTVTSVVLNSSSNINLTEDTTTSISWTASVTDSNGYLDISTVSGKLYRSGVTNGAACTPDNNNCYAAASCSLTSCGGNSCTATCTVNMQFHADPTDSGSTYASEYWLSQVTATDSAASQHSATSPVSVNEVNSLVASSVTSNINFGTLLPGANTSTENETVVVTNTGNVPIDVEISGSDLCPDYPTCAGDTIPIANQQYGLSAFTYGAGTTLTGSGVLVQLNVAKPTQSPSNQTGAIYWGIALPGSLTPGTYTGVNQIIGVDDQ